VATKKSSWPLYEVFLERVIRIDAMQRHRAAAVTDDERTAQFFDAGRRPGSFGDFKWSLDSPAADDWGPLAPSTGEKPAPMSSAMQQAWDAVVAAWRTFIAELAAGELIASGVHPASGVRSEIDPAEWTRTGLVLDVRNGDLIEGLYDRPYGKHTVRWSTIVLRTAVQEQKLGTIDWDAEWNEDVARREKGQLPNKRGYLRELETRIQERYGVSSVDGGDLRRFKAALYRGDVVRPRKK
jgi:hypothetical protein